MNNRMLLKLASLNNKKVNLYLTNFINEAGHLIKKSKSNDEIYAKLELLDDIIYINSKDVLGIIDFIVKSKKILPAQKYKTDFGEIEGKSSTEVLHKCISLLEKIRYINTKEVFDFLILLSTRKETDAGIKATDLVRRMAHYDPFALQQIRFQPQIIILSKIEKWSGTKKLKYLNIVNDVCGQLLNPSYEGTSLKGRTMTFHGGPLKTTKELVDIRKRTIELLQEVYFLAKKSGQKKAILSVLETASHTPRQGVYSDDMGKMVLENTKTIIDYFVRLLPKAENDIISKIEEQIRRFKDEKLPEVKDLKGRIDQNEEYKIYRLFVGYEGRFSEELSWEEREKRRKDKILEIIAGIKEENFKIWKKRIFDIIKKYSASDPGGYQYFYIFLNELAKQKPLFAIRLLGKNIKIPSLFLVALVSGILRSSDKQKGEEIIKGWIKKGANLDVCANVFSYDMEVDKEIISLLFKKAKENKDIGALDGIIKILANNYPKYKNKKIFIDVLKELTKLKDCSWVNDVWYQKNSILDSLDSNDRKSILDNLLFSSNVSHYHIEEILAFIARDNPKLITDFFYNRIKLKEKKKRETSYDAIPFNLHVLGETLAKDGNAVIVIKEILKWFDEKEWFFSWDAGSLLQAIFPVFNEKLETILLNIIKKGGEHNAKIVISILDKYDGQIFIHKVCQEFIKKYPGKKGYINSIIHALSKTGTVMGEYGFVNAYKKKKEEIQGWKKDKNKKIISFVKDYEDYLDKQIEYEQKRADEQIELMKRNFE